MSGVDDRPFAVVTGGSNGIGLELASQFAGNGYDLPIAARVAIHAGDLGQEDAVDGLYRDPV